MQNDSVATRWIAKPRPNLLWHNIENQRFVDPSRYPVDKSLDDTHGDSSEENDDADESQDGQSGTMSDNGDEKTPEKEAGAELEAEVGVDLDPSKSTSKGQEHSQATVPGCETEYWEDTVLRFLDVAQDHESRHAAVKRLHDFFHHATLNQSDRYHEGLEGRTGCQTVIDDRNFTSRLYRRYPRPMDPAEVYGKLMEKVRVNLPISHHGWFR